MPRPAHGRGALARLPRAPARRAGVGGVPRQAGVPVPGWRCPGRAAPAGPRRPRGRCPPLKFGGGRGLCSRGASGGPGRGGRAGCLGGCRARRVGTAAAPEQECSRAPAATGPLKVQPGSAAAPPGYLPRLGGDWESCRSALAECGQGRSGTKNSGEGTRGAVGCGFSEQGNSSMKSRR